MIAKWYPSKDDPQFGVFIQKHAKAIAIDNKVVVLYAYSSANQKEIFQFETHQQNNLLEIIISFKKNVSVFGELVNAYRYFRAINSGIKKSKQFYNKPDLIHSYILLRTGLIASYLSFIYKIPYVINEQWSGYATGKFAGFSLIKKIVTRKLVKHSTGLISVSNFLLEKMHSCEIRNENEIVIPNTVEPVVELKESTENTVNILLVADLVDEIKNISAVIKVVGKLAKENHDFVLRIIGHGKDKEMLMEIARELGVLNTRVIFEGLKSNQEVYSYLKRCDFLVMNSRFETFSLICCEALSCGKPVLATRCGGPQEFVDSEVGVMIDVDSSIQLEQNFLFMLKNHRQFDSQKIISKVKNRFSQDTVNKLYNGFYQKILDPKN